MAPTVSRYGAMRGARLQGYDSIPAGIAAQLFWLNAEDGGEVRGLLYARGGEKTAVLISHPRSSYIRHYLIPYFLEAGFAVLGLECRFLNNDIFCIHELLLLDVAAGVKFLREERDYENVIGVGNSGGGSLLAFYQAEAQTAPPERLTTTPAGDRCDLNAYSMIPLDGCAMVGAHLGEGFLLMDAMDPSVIDEADPTAIDPELDMFDARNGYRGSAVSAKYSPEFVLRYRQAQRERVARIDAVARSHIEQQRSFGELADATNDSHPFKQRLQQRSVMTRYLIINRVEADLRFCDLSIEPSKRSVGSLESIRPEISNFSDTGGFGRVMSPRGWLSTWSGLSSRANLPGSLQKITVPVLFVIYTGDNGFFPGGERLCASAAISKDFSRKFLDLEHGGWPLEGGPYPKAGVECREGRRRAGEAVTAWMRARWPG
jgi:hypothetical protein